MNDVSAFTHLDLSKMIDHSLLNPTLNEEALERGIQVALAYDTGSVCIMPFALKRCATLLKGSSVKASTTIGFPHGGHTTDAKLAETIQALREGGQELDMVVNISKVLSGDWDYVESDIRIVVDIAHEAGQQVKVIFENCYLNMEQKIRLCQICTELGADWVKTSTGYGTSGSTDEDLKLMREHAGPDVQVKAAGGIRDLDALLRVRALGITRVGATATAVIMDEFRRRVGLEPIAAPPEMAPTGY